nr:leishmanolysin-like peptidase isoform X2 [Pogona vitticeps]
MAAGPRGWGVFHPPRLLSVSFSSFAALLLLGSPPPSAVASPLCHHRVPNAKEVIYKVYLKENHVKKRHVNEHLRIRTVYDRSVEELLPEKKHLIKHKLFPQAISYLENTFQVRKSTGTVLLSRQCVTNRYLRKKDDPHRYCQGACAEHTRCGPVIVPEEHLQQCRVCSENGRYCGPTGQGDQEGVRDADFILYVSALTTEKCGQDNIIAYAAHCQLEADMDRPIAGYANLCPSMISIQAQEFVGMLSTVKHEIIHALGFSAGLFAFYHDDDGNPLTARYANGLPPFNESLGIYQWSSNVVRHAVRLWDVRGNRILRHHVFLLITPKVVAEARKHFDCPILEGMELENQGGMGTELNHWEKRLLENEAMTGSHTQNRVFSRITLALMEDTGWYKANYSMAEQLVWGRGKGCDFVMKSCKFWIDRRRRKKEVVDPYCDTLRSNPLQLTCRQDHRAVAVCNLQKFPQQLPQEYQYFDSLYGVSSEDLPYYDPFKNYGAEKYGPNSICLIQKSAFVMEQCRKKLSYPDWGSGCYQVSCTPRGLIVWVKDAAYLCSHSGQILTVNIQMNGWVHVGNLICPTCSDFCDFCPPEQDPPPVANLTRVASIDLCSCSPSLVVTLWLLMVNLLPLLAGFLLCAWS